MNLSQSDAEAVVGPAPTTESKLASVQPITVNQPPKANSPKLISKVEQFSGPMPPPALLSHYEDICPGSADRMLRMAEQEAEHRRKTEEKIVNAQIEYSNKHFAEARCGQICALLITLSALAAGVYTAVNGHEIAGSVIGVGGIGGIVTTFIFGRRDKQPQEANGHPQSAPKPNGKHKKKNNKR
jgi:uncharacterized membrane protein